MDAASPCVKECRPWEASEKNNINYLEQKYTFKMLNEQEIKG